VRELERVDLIETNPRFAEARIRTLHEIAYALERR